MSKQVMVFVVAGVAIAVILFIAAWVKGTKIKNTRIKKVK